VIHLGNFESLTAFYVDQVNRRPWTDDLNIPKGSRKEVMAEIEKIRADILEAARELGEPFTAKQMEEKLGNDKSRTRCCLEWHERQNNLARVNVRGRLHWKLI
jgi:hypothetical protein